MYVKLYTLSGLVFHVTIPLSLAIQIQDFFFINSFFFNIAACVLVYLFGRF